MNRWSRAGKASLFAALLSLGMEAPAPAAAPEADRALVSPTALVQPARSVTVSSLEGVLVGLSFAPVSRVQATAVLLPSPVVATGGSIGLKVLAYDGPATKLALLAAGAWIQELLDDSRGTHSFYLAGAVVTRCWDDCQSSVSGFISSGHRSYDITFGGSLGHAYTPITFAANGLLRLAGGWSFVLDLTEWGRTGCEGCVDQPLDKLLIAYGLRYRRGRFGATLGLATGVDLQSLDVRPLTLPLLTAAYRLGGPAP